MEEKLLCWHCQHWSTHIYSFLQNNDSFDSVAGAWSLVVSNPAFPCFSQIKYSDIECYKKQAHFT